jgi:hypothetical protein
MIPGRPTAITPVGTAEQNRPTFEWSDEKYAEWYQLWVNRGSAKHFSKWVQTSSYTPTVAQRLRYERYQWWVHPWAPDGYGPWSQTASFTYGVPELLGPVGTVLGTRQPEFTWTRVDAAEWYNVWVGRDGGPSSSYWVSNTTAAADMAGPATFQWTPPSALRFGSFDWYVRAWNPDGVGPWSEGLAFEIGKAIPVSPSGALGGSPTEMRWNAEGCQEAAWYHFWISADGAMYTHFWVAKADTTAHNGERTAAIPAKALPMPADSYTWWVQTWHSSGYGPWSDGLSFTVP